MAKMVAIRRKGGGAQLRNERAGSWTVAKRAAFLDHLAQTLNVRASVAAVGMGITGLYRLRRREPGFAEAMRAVLRDGYEAIEMLLVERAVLGMQGDLAAVPGGARLEKLSERAMLGLLAHHRQVLRDQRDAAAAIPAAGGDGGAQARLEAKLAEMAARLADEAGNDGAGNEDGGDGDGA